jgi:glycerol-3-phosphate dehydrogenase
MMRKSAEVVVIGGGATGCGVLFDLAQRGFKCLLLERGGLSMGTSGRFHGLLHSGGRYVTNDPQAAVECIEENQILRRTMPHAIEDTGGLFVTTPWDPPAFADLFYESCLKCGVPVQEISTAEALRREALLNPKISRAFEVPDATVDTWEACLALVATARAYGAEALIYHQVVDLIIRNGAVQGVRARNTATGEETTIECDMVVNAAGAWGGQVARLAGCEVTIYAGKGVMIAMNYRMVNTVINRCLPPSDGDILVPVRTVAVIGTTSVRVADPDDYAIEDWEIKLMMDEGEKLVPSFKQFRPLRAWAGVRPLYQEKAAGADLRDVSRAYTLLDHATRDGVDNFVTITGGKWVTHRQMAERTVDLVCHKLGLERPCRTATTLLKTPDEPKYYTLGERLKKLESGELAGQLICECELVTRPQIEANLVRYETHIVNDLRRDLRLGMGPCQGGFCAYRAAGIMHEHKNLSARETNKALVDFLEERWKGMTSILWGQQLRQVLLDAGIYLGLLGLDKLPVELTAADRPRLGEVETEGFYEIDVEPSLEMHD